MPNEPQSALAKTIRDLIFEVAIKQVIARAIVAAPFLAYPIINPVFIFIVGKLFDVIYAEMSLTVSFVLIDFKYAHHKAAYDQAVNDLKLATEAQDAKEIETAKDNFRATLRDLVRMRPG